MSSSRAVEKQTARPDRLGASVDLQGPCVGEGRPCWDLSASWSEQRKVRTALPFVPTTMCCPKCTRQNHGLKPRKLGATINPFYFNFRLILSQVL